MEVPATKEERVRAIADVMVTYGNMQTKTTDRLTSAVAVRFSSDQVLCDASHNTEVLEKSVLLISNAKNRRATRMRDEGRLREARLLLIDNSDFLGINATALNSALLKLWADENREQAKYLDGKDWNRTRKRMVQRQNAVDVQQSGYGGYGGGYGSSQSDSKTKGSANTKATKE